MFLLAGFIALISGTATVRAGATPLGKVEPGTAPGCSWWFENRDGSTNCQLIPDLYQISREDYLAWNPTLTSECGNFKVGYAYCVEATTPTGTVTTKVPTPTATPNGITTPLPTLPGMHPNCYKFHKFKSGETCKTIAAANKINAKDISFWNPYAGDGCKFVPVDTNICVAVFPNIPAYKHYGCYNEAYVGYPGMPTNYHGLNHSSTLGLEILTAAWCSAFCLGEKGQSYFGLELGNQCWCGSALAIGSNGVPQTDCNVTCTGDSTKKCGAQGRLDMYGREDAVAPVGYRLAGCYTEATNARALDLYSKRSDAMTIEMCGNYCIGEKGTKLFDVQNGNECWCGNALAAGSVPTAESGCVVKCGGNTKQNCGGKLGVMNLFTVSQDKP